MIRSMQQELLKYKLHQELQLKHREFFESTLAVNLLEHGKYESVKKISSVIIKLIESNKKIVEDLIESKASILAELKEPFFGSYYSNTEHPSPSEIAENICSILRDEKSDLRCVMQIHCIFIHRIYDYLEKRSEKAALVNTIFVNPLFSNENRSRTETKESHTHLTAQLGISRHPVFSKKLGVSDKKHSSAIEKYKLDYNGAFFKSALAKNIPIVCGPSGHTGSLLLGAKLYGNFTPEQMNEYALISFAFLTAGGNHSFHEVMIVAQLVGVEFEPGNYAKSIPPSIMQLDLYKKLSHRFSELLDDNTCTKQPLKIRKLH